MMEFEIETALQELATGPGLCGIGNDLVHLPAFERSFNPTFIRRVFNPHEIDYCDQFDYSLLRYASTWAAKEAVYKAVKQADKNIKLWWRGIEITRNKPQGRPIVTVSKLADNFEIFLTITHDGEYVWAMAVCREKTGNACCAQKKARTDLSL